MKSSRFILAILALVAMALPNAWSAPAADAAAADPALAAKANNSFALRLFERLRAAEGNLFFSPYSISSALSMTLAGAGGETQTQLAKTLGLTGQARAQAQSIAAFQSLIREGAEGVELHSANSLWVQDGFALLKRFTQRMNNAFGAAPQTVDFKKDAEAARGQINRWVEKETKEKIKDLIPLGAINDSTRLVLANAIYFKGDWVAPFDESSTREAPFTLANGEEIKVPTMSQTAEFGLAEDADCMALEMPYKGEALGLMAILPKSKDGLAKLEEKLTLDKVEALAAAMETRKVYVTLPKFKNSSQLSLAETLRAMGCEAPFSDQADFSKMSEQEGLAISAVLHKAFVEVNERGSEAAAATAITMRATSVPMTKIPEFRADHPFVFLIRHRASGAILFAGRLADPTKE